MKAPNRYEDSRSTVTLAAKDRSRESRAAIVTLRNMRCPKFISGDLYVNQLEPEAA
jgi:hypothetical protein